MILLLQCVVKFRDVIAELEVVRTMGELDERCHTQSAERDSNVTTKDKVVAKSTKHYDAAWLCTLE